MIPTREDLIVLLSRLPQASIPALVQEYGCDPVTLLRVLESGDDFERCAPRTEDGHGFAWRLSLLAVDPRVRSAATTHLRAVERPPQSRDGARPAGAASVLLDWLRANPGEWTLTQIAHARGVSLVTVRGHLKAHRAALNSRLETAGKHGGKHLVISLKQPGAACR